MFGWVAQLCAVLQRIVGTSDEPHRDNPAEARAVEDLLQSMTFAEKVGQMTQADLVALEDKSDIQKYALGSILSSGDTGPPDISPGGWAVAYNECQSWAMKTRLKIPLIYGIDAVHGHNKVDGAVIFPHNIGLGASRNPSLVELRFFAGLTMPEIDRVLKILLATAERHWTYARTWLFAELKDRGNSANP
jgi:hypothetical protein